MKPAIMIAAGGTGGHMVPAHALSETLAARGYSLALITDRRGQRYPGLFDGVEAHVIEAGSPGRGSLVRRLSAGFSIMKGVGRARRLLRDTAAGFVIGFGGYPAFPAILAARLSGLPYGLHEQNAVLGRANRLLARDAALVALGVAKTQRLPSLKGALIVTGNPVRRQVRAYADAEFAPPGDGGPIRLLVVGGSQGAHILSAVVPAALARLDTALKARLRVVQQCRAEDQAAVEAAYREAGIEHYCAPFMEDLPARLAAAHLVVARAGASTLAELCVIGRPAILVPLAIAADNHQHANAAALEAAGAAIVIEETAFEPAALAGHVAALLGHPHRLSAAADAARGLAVADSAEQLADAIEAGLDRQRGGRQ